ncbi:MAG TPA: serine protease, partial [Blastocatellia bacterium]|nr:serine protease [Blastocatellia bacterium]
MKTSHKLLKPLYIAVVLPGLIFGSTPQGAKRKKTEQVTIVTLTSLNSKNQVISTGAGFIVSDGVIATSYGVVRNAAKIRAELATETARTVQLLAVDQHRSVALLKLTGDSPDILRVLYRKDPLPGDRVYVVGGGATPDPISATIGQPVSVGRTHYVTVKLSGSNPPAGSPIVDQNGEVVGLLGVENGGTVSFLVPVSSI